MIILHFPAQKIAFSLGHIDPDEKLLRLKSVKIFLTAFTRFSLNSKGSFYLPSKTEAQPRSFLSNFHANRKAQSCVAASGP